LYLLIFWLLRGQGCPQFSVVEGQGCPQFLGEIVLAGRVGFALRFSEFDKVYKTEICVSVVLMIHL
jgi:hypothetical protein